MKSRNNQSPNLRKSIDSSSDPYLSVETHRGSAVCPHCHAVYSNKRWKLDDTLFEKERSDESVKKVLCPACKKVRDNFPGGIVFLKGRFLDNHKDEVLNLVRNEEKRARGVNPLERIMNIRYSEGGVEISTTNEKLAQRIGRRMQKAYQGTVKYKWSDDTKLLRAEWERNQD